MMNTCNKSPFVSRSLASIVSIISILTISVTVHAAAPSIKQALTECAQQTNSLQRLVCYDRISAQLQDYANDAPTPTTAPKLITAQSTPPVAPHNAIVKAPEAKIAPSPITKSITVPIAKPITEPVKDAVASFGKTVATEDSMIATIASVKTGRNNLMTITLDNGQVWLQTKSEDRARLSAQQVVTFEKGFFGAFYLSAEGSNRRVAVKRLK
jgi:hypothetical protein